jgi:hypothetical protein
MMIRCPKCDAELEVQEAEPDVGIMSAGAYCDACDLVVDVEHEYHDDDVGIAPGPRDRPLGTPISQLSGRPGHDGFAAFQRIAKTWGYD